MLRYRRSEEFCDNVSANHTLTRGYLREYSDCALSNTHAARCELEDNLACMQNDPPSSLQHSLNLSLFFRSPVSPGSSRHLRPSNYKNQSAAANLPPADLEFVSGALCRSMRIHTQYSRKDITSYNKK